MANEDDIPVLATGSSVITLRANLPHGPPQPGFASTTATVYVIPEHYFHRQTERVRVNQLLPIPIDGASRRQDKTYAKWKRGHLEITDTLLGSQICPNDLLGVPCEFDEFPSGCQMVRLCKMLEKYTKHVCPDGNQRDKNENPYTVPKCGHIHWEVEISCRFIATMHIKPERVCKLVLHKGKACAVGHDFESARQQSRDQRYVHIDAARGAGSLSLVKFGWQY